MKLSKFLSAFALAALVACSPEFKYEVQPAETLELSCAAVTFTAAAASQTVEVESSAGWKAVTDGSAEWFSVEKGEGIITISATANSEVHERSGVVTVSTATRSVEVVVSQTGADFSFATDVTETDVAFGAVAKSVAVTANIAWTAVPTVGWIVPSVEEGTGNATVSYNVLANSSIYEREGWLDFYNGDLRVGRVKVNQAALIPEMTFSSQSIAKTEAAFSESIQVTTNYPWTYELRPIDACWLTVKAPAAAADHRIPLGTNQTVTISASGTVPARSGKVTFHIGDKDYVVNVSQSGGETTLTSASPALDFPPVESSLNLEFESNNIWEFTDVPDWITPSVVAGIGGSQTIQINADRTLGPARDGSFKILSGDKVQTVTVSQSAGARTVEVLYCPFLANHTEAAPAFDKFKDSTNPFTDKFTSGYAKSYNLGVITKVLKNDPDLTMYFFSNVGFCDGNSSNGIRMTTVFVESKANDKTQSRKIRNENFAYIQFPAIPNLTLKKVVTWCSHTSSTSHIAYITSSALVSNAEAEAKRVTPKTQMLKYKNELVLENPQPETSYYLFLDSGTTEKTYQFYNFILYYEL